MLGKTIQDLVAEGQLTEEQYAELLITINSLVKSGDVDKSDLTPEFKGEIEGFSAQLAQKANNVDVMNKMASKRDKSTLIGVNDFDGETLGYLQDGVGGATINIESVPKDKSVTPEKTDFVSVDQRNLFDKTKATDGYRLDTSGVPFEVEDYTLSNFIRVQNGTDYKIGFAVEGYDTYRVCAYDENKVFIKTLSSISYGAQAIDITIDFDGYIRVPFEKSGKDIAFVSNADVYDGYHPYQIIGGSLRAKPLSRSVGSDEIEIGGVNAEHTDFLIQTKNLFNRTEAVANSIVSATTGEINFYNGLYTTGFIKVNRNESVTLSTVRRLVYYNEEKNYLGSSTLVNNPDNTQLTITPPNNGYIRASFLSEHVGNLQVQKGNTINEYELYGYKLPYLITDSNNKNNLSGKSVFGFGDSIMYGGVNGLLEMIANDNGMISMNYGSNGATVAPRDGYDNQIIKKVREAITAGETADYILFNGLTNDANVTDASRLGEISTGYDMPSDVTTFSGAFEELIKTMRDEWVASKIIYVRVHNMDSRGDRQILFGERAIEICKKWSIPVVDLYNEGNLNTQIAEMKRLYTVDTYDTGLGDGTHPNEEGYRRFYVPPIEAKMKTV